MLLRDLKETIDSFKTNDLNLPIKEVAYLNEVNVTLEKGNYLGHKCILIFIESKY
jgi:hypothetical protein